MYVFFRLGWILLKGLFKNKLHPLDRLLTRSRVYPSDLDFYLHVNNGRYLTLMDLGRMDFLMRTGMIRMVVSKGWRAVIGKAQIRFIRPLHGFQAFTIGTRISFWDDSGIYIDHELISKGEVCATATLKAVITNRGARMPMQVVFKELGIVADPPPMPDYIRPLLPAESSSQRAS